MSSRLIETRLGSLALGALACCALTAAAPVTSAQASGASIKQVLKEDIPKITAEEGKFIEALSQYEKTGNVAPVEESLDANIGLLQQMRAEIGKQSAGKQSAENKRVRRARAEIKRALGRVISAYRHLKSAFSVKGANPKVAKKKAKTALKAINKADRELTQAAKLLG